LSVSLAGQGHYMVNYTEIERQKSISVIILLLLIFCLVFLAFSFQGTRGIWQPDEGYYTGTAITMLGKDTLLIPFLGEDEIFLDKPPFIYWGIIAGIKIFGHTEFAARFFHGLCFFLTAVAVGFLSHSMFKNMWLAMLSCLVYATMVVPFIAANFITPDTILTLWTTLSALCFWNSIKSQGKIRILWQMLLCAAVGFGFLAKGPAVLIPCGAMFVVLLVEKKLLQYFLTRWSLLGVLIFIITGLGWYIWVGVKLPGAFSYFVDNQILGRLFTEKYNRNPGLTGALIYLPVIALGSLPWSSIWLEKKDWLKTTFLNRQWWKVLPQKPPQLFLVCYFFVPVVVLCAASSKLGLYALPVFVPLAIATAKMWMEKTPYLKSFALGDILKSYARPIKLTIFWCLLLLMSRFSLAYYPTHNNMKTLWSQIKPHLPMRGCELCTIDERADGLLFYGVSEVEHLTNKYRPYPTFTKTETMLEEMYDLSTSDENVFFLVRGDNEVVRAVEILKKSGINCKIIKLPYQRAMIFPCFSGVSDKPEIEVEPVPILMKPLEMIGTK